MEYIKSIDDSLTTIDEDIIEYLNIFDFPNLIHGNINF